MLQKPFIAWIAVGISLTHISLAADQTTRWAAKACEHSLQILDDTLQQCPKHQQEVEEAGLLLAAIDTKFRKELEQLSREQIGAVDLNRGASCVAATTYKGGFTLAGGAALELKKEQNRLEEVQEKATIAALYLDAL